MVAGAAVQNERTFQLDRKVLVIPVTWTAYVIWAIQQQHWNL